MIQIKVEVLDTKSWEKTKTIEDIEKPSGLFILRRDKNVESIYLTEAGPGDVAYDSKVS